MIETIVHLGFVALFGAFAGLALAHAWAFGVVIAILGITMALMNALETSEAAVGA